MSITLLLIGRALGILLQARPHPSQIARKYPLMEPPEAFRERGRLLACLTRDEFSGCLPVIPRRLARRCIAPPASNATSQRASVCATDARNRVVAVRND
jgi:hypothetical protein